MTGLAEADGWTFGGTIAGHLVGQFPHEKIAGEDIESYIAPGSDKPMRRTDRNGQACHWILEVHLVDLDRADRRVLRGAARPRPGAWHCGARPSPRWRRGSR